MKFRNNSQGVVLFFLENLNEKFNVSIKNCYLEDIFYLRKRSFKTCIIGSNLYDLQWVNNDIKSIEILKWYKNSFSIKSHKKVQTSERSIKLKQTKN